MYHLLVSVTFTSQNSPVVVRSQANRSVQCPLQVTFLCVRLKKLQQRLCAEFRFQAPLERILGLFLVVQPLRKLAEDLPLGRQPHRLIERTSVPLFRYDMCCVLK